MSGRIFRFGSVGGADILASDRLLFSQKRKSLGSNLSSAKGQNLTSRVPTPDVPPIFVIHFSVGDASRAGCPSRSGERIAKHGQATDRCFLCRFVLDDVPVLGQLAIL